MLKKFSYIILFILAMCVFIEVLSYGLAKEADFQLDRVAKYEQQ